MQIVKDRQGVSEGALDFGTSLHNYYSCYCILYIF